MASLSFHIDRDTNKRSLKSAMANPNMSFNGRREVEEFVNDLQSGRWTEECKNNRTLRLKLIEQLPLMADLVFDGKGKTTLYSRLCTKVMELKIIESLWESRSAMESCEKTKKEIQEEEGFEKV